MTDRSSRIDRMEMLAWIEGELPAARALELERALSSQPEVLEELRRMRADRVRLQSLPEPVVPEGLLAELETRLARPMLIAGPPGAWRRAHRRGRQIRRLVAWSAGGVAAAILLAFGIGLWPQWRSLLQGGARDRQADGRATTESRRPGDADASAADADPAAGDITRPALLVHGLPSPSADRGDAGDRAVDGPADVRPPLIVAADLVLECSAGDVDGVERVLLRALTLLDADTAWRARVDAAVPADPAAARGGSDSATAAIDHPPAALVRNLSRAEVMRVISHPDFRRGTDAGADRWADHRRAAGALGASDAGGAVPGSPARSAGQALAPPGGGPERGRMPIPLPAGASVHGELADLLWARPLHGPETLHPDIETQMRSADHGAMHTLTIRVDELPEFLAIAAERSGESTVTGSLERDGSGVLRLRPLGADRGPADLSVWISEIAEVREALIRVRERAQGRSDREIFIQIPVRVAAPAATDRLRRP